MDDADVNGKQIVWLREVSIDMVAADSHELDEDKISSRLWDAQREAERELKTVYRRFPRYVNGQDIVELFEEGVFEKSKRLTIFKDDVFVKFMPSAAYDFGWAWFKDRLLAKVVLAGGQVDTELLSLVSPVKTAKSQEWGTVKKQADGTIFPESYLELENYCPSVIVEIGASENSSELIVDKEWWLDFAKRSVHGELMLLILIDISAAKRRMAIRFYPTPDFDEDTSRTLDLSLDDPIPAGTKVVFLLEWLYGAVTPPEWLQGKSIVMDHEDLDQWRRLVRTSLYAT